MDMSPWPASVGMDSWEWPTAVILDIDYVLLLYIAESRNHPGTI